MPSIPMCSICQTNPSAPGSDLCALCGSRRTVAAPADKATVDEARRAAYRTSRGMETGRYSRVMTAAELAQHRQEREDRLAEHEAERRAEQAAEARHVGDQVVGWDGSRARYRSEYR